MYGGQYGADEGDNPRKLYKISTQPHAGPERRRTHNADGDSGQRERVANDAADAEGRPLCLVVSVFHFAQGRSAQRAVGGHMLIRRDKGVEVLAGEIKSVGAGVKAGGYASLRSILCCGVVMADA